MEPWDDFDVAVASLATSGNDLAFELLAQLRPTGRILDNFRLSVNGTEILNAELEFNQLLPAPAPNGFKLRFQYWPCDVSIRRNLTTGGWIDVPDLVAANNAMVLDPEGAGVSNNEFRRILEELPDDGPESCSIRWAVVVGEDGLLKLQLQVLPSDTASLNGRPLTKG